MRACTHGDVIHENNRIRRLNEQLQREVERLEKEALELARQLGQSQRNERTASAMAQYYRIRAKKPDGDDQREGDIDWSDR